MSDSGGNGNGKDRRWVYHWLAGGGLGIAMALAMWRHTERQTEALQRFLLTHVADVAAGERSAWGRLPELVERAAVAQHAAAAAMERLTRQQVELCRVLGSGAGDGPARGDFGAGDGGGSRGSRGAR